MDAQTFQGASLAKDLESSKNSVQLMLQVLDLAQKTATPGQVNVMLLLFT